MTWRNFTIRKWIRLWGFVSPRQFGLSVHTSSNGIDVRFTLTRKLTWLDLGTNKGVIS